MRLYLTILLTVLIISSICYAAYYISLHIKYKKYLKIPAPASGLEAASMMMQRNGIESQFAIYKGKSKNPFYGNFYLPDKNIFVMKREIMDGKNLLALAVGCQLAASALRYQEGDIGKKISTIFDDEYALKYVYNKEELENLEKSTLVIHD